MQAKDGMLAPLGARPQFSGLMTCPCNLCNHLTLFSLDLSLVSVQDYDNQVLSGTDAIVMVDHMMQTA